MWCQKTADNHANINDMQTFKTEGNDEDNQRMIIKMVS